MIFKRGKVESCVGEKLQYLEGRLGKLACFQKRFGQRVVIVFLFFVLMF